MIRCVTCGHESAYGTRVCVACGASLPAAGFPLGAAYAEGLGQVCPKCHHFLDLEASACSSCGLSLVVMETDTEPEARIATAQTGPIEVPDEDQVPTPPRGAEATD